MSFSSDISRFVFSTKTRTKATYVGVATGVHESIVGTGSPHPITGAPGQPVGQYGPGYNEGSVGGNLKGSWTLAIGEKEATVSTNVAYARGIEDGVGPHGPIKLRSTIGGFHSVKMTIAGASALQADVVRRLG